MQSGMQPLVVGYIRVDSPELSDLQRDWWGQRGAIRECCDGLFTPNSYELLTFHDLVDGTVGQLCCEGTRGRPPTMNLADALDELSADAPGRPVHLVFVGISYLACRLREEHEAGGIPHTQRGIQAHFIENADEADPTFPEGTGPR